MLGDESSRVLAHVVLQTALGGAGGNRTPFQRPSTFTSARGFTPATIMFTAGRRMPIGELAELLTHRGAAGRDALGGGW